MDETTDGDLLASADGNALRIASDAVKNVTDTKWNLDRKTNGVMEFPYPEYPNGMWSIASIFESDSEYLENYKQYCEGVLSTEMNVRQIRTMLIYLVHGEKYCDGFINKYLENHYLLKLLLRPDDLLIDYYQRHQLPVELRYKNPVFWYEMDHHRTVFWSDSWCSAYEKQQLFCDHACSWCPESFCQMIGKIINIATVLRKNRKKQKWRNHYI